MRPDPTLASARPDPRAGEDGELAEAVEVAWLEFRRLTAAPLPRGAFDFSFRAGADSLLRRLRAAEAERDAHEAEAERLRSRLHDPKGTSRELERFCREVHRDVLCECGHVAEVHTVRVGLHGHYERCCTDRACGCDEFALARASQGDPATGTRSVPRPTEEERG